MRKRSSKATRRKAAVASKARQTSRGRRFTGEQRKHALVLVASGMKRSEIAEAIGTTTESVRRWVREAEANGGLPKVPATPRASGKAPSRAEASGGNGAAAKPSLYAPKDPGQGLASHEVAAILEYKQQHPSYGPAQIRAQLKRFKGWRMARKAIAKVLREHGYELVHRGSRPQGDEQPQRFEAPRRNALWQLDFCEVRVAGQKLHVLIALDDFSRYAVGHVLADSPSSAVATAVLRQAIARHGKPEAVRTDRAGAFTAKTADEDFGRVLEVELIDHIVGRSYHPQGGGKVEALVQTLRRELWNVEHFDSRQHAERRTAEFFADYNERRAHMGIDGLTPADRYFGRGDRVLDVIDALSRNRQGTLAQQQQGKGAVEELSDRRCGAPLEVLRLVIVDGVMELRFCGARVRLGQVAV